MLPLCEELFVYVALRLLMLVPSKSLMNVPEGMLQYGPYLSYPMGE